MLTGIDPQLGGPAGPGVGPASARRLQADPAPVAGAVAQAHVLNDQGAGGEHLE